MIFRQFLISDEGEFFQFGQTRYGHGFANMLAQADHFFQEIGSDYFPTLQIEEGDKEDDNFKTCIRQMFLCKQVEFFLMRGWCVRLVNMDTKERASQDFQVSDGNFKQEVHVIFGALVGSRKKFWVDGFMAGMLLIHVSGSTSRKDAISV